VIPVHHLLMITVSVWVCGVVGFDIIFGVFERLGFGVWTSDILYDYICFWRNDGVVCCII
jgi:hypothetical protein